MDSVKLIKWIEKNPRIIKGYKNTEIKYYECLVEESYEFQEEYDVCVGVRDIPKDREKYGGDSCSGIEKVNIPVEKRLVIRAYNEGGYNSTEVDLLTFLKWVKDKHPELLGEIQ